ncbi:hypothetical protein TYRP_019432 [Tyrophagus putrescentiae]|nr:hypothetical protein TYRP_019432 [Tyrophagus putrescentiae]
MKEATKSSGKPVTKPLVIHAVCTRLQGRKTSNSARNIFPYLNDKQHRLQVLLSTEIIEIGGHHSLAGVVVGQRLSQAVQEEPVANGGGVVHNKNLVDRLDQLDVNFEEQVFVAKMSIKLKPSEFPRMVVDGATKSNKKYQNSFNRFLGTRLVMPGVNSTVSYSTEEFSRLPLLPLFIKRAIGVAA